MSTSELKLSVFGVPPDNYSVAIFDLASNGLPPALSGSPNFVAEEDDITVIGPGEAKGKVCLSGSHLLGLCMV